jgi:hypothetical protein
MFREIEVAPTGASRKVEASLQGVDAAASAHMKLDEEGGAHAVTPKTKYIMPAIQVLLATSSMDLDHHQDHIEAGNEGGDVAGAGVRGVSGFSFAGGINLPRRPLPTAHHRLCFLWGRLVCLFARAGTRRGCDLSEEHSHGNSVRNA